MQFYLAHCMADQTFCDRLAEALRAARHTVTYEVFHEEPLVLSAEAEAGLHTADVFLLVLSQAALGVPRLQREAHVFNEQHMGAARRNLYPILLETAAFGQLWPILAHATTIPAQHDVALTHEELVRAVFESLDLDLPPGLSFLATTPVPILRLSETPTRQVSMPLANSSSRPVDPAVSAQFPLPPPIIRQRQSRWVLVMGMLLLVLLGLLAVLFVQEKPLGGNTVGQGGSSAAIKSPTPSLGGQSPTTQTTFPAGIPTQNPQAPTATIDLATPTPLPIRALMPTPVPSNTAVPPSPATTVPTNTPIPIATPAPTTFGAPLWRMQTGSSIESSPTIFNNLVIFGSNDTYVYAVYATDGSLAWKFKTNSAVRSTPTVANGIVEI